jgi:hypothetical protein
MAIAEKYPLQWPAGYPATRWPKKSKFGNQSFAKCRDEIFRQLKMMLNYNEMSTVVLSTNIPLKLDGLPYAGYRQPENKGVAVYFLYGKESVVLCCDQWDKIEHNLWAVAKTIESLRSIERWGVSDFIKRSFTGFNALPPSSSQPIKKREWWIVLGYQQMPGLAVWDWEGITAQYKSLAKKLHPDTGGSVSAFQELNEAYQQAKNRYGK